MDFVNQHDWSLFFLQVCVMLTAALVFGQMMRKLHQPAVLGELIGGILLGPTIFGALAPKAHAWLFPIGGRTLLAREAVINIGMLFFLFIAGLEVNLARLQRRGLSTALTSILGCLVPFSLGFGSVLFLPDLWGSHAQEKATIFALFIGTALSISALPVIARILMDLDLIHKDVGVIMMAAVTIDDLIGWSLFAVVLGFFAPGSPGRSLWGTLGLVVGVWILTWGLGRWLVRTIARRVQFSVTRPGGSIGVIAVLVLGAAALVESLGIHAIFGAFLVGIALGQGFNLGKENHIREIIYQFAVSFFAPLYFVSVGLKVDFAANFDPLLVLFVIVIASVGKLVGAGLGAWLGGMAPKEAIAVGFGMNARGAIEMILASVALEYKVIDQRIFVALVIMAFVTSMLSGPLLQRLTRQPG